MSTVLLEVDARVSRLKAKEKKLVDRGDVALKILSDTSRRSFWFVGTFDYSICCYSFVNVGLILFYATV